MTEFDTAAVIECASLAPSVHNTQPWKFVPTGSGLDMLADSGRQLDYLDPTSRQLHVSCGAALEFAVVTTRAVGRACHVQLLPDPARADLLAHVEVGGEEPASTPESDLAGAIPRRYTDRGPYSDRPVPPAVLVDVQTRCAEL